MWNSLFPKRARLFGPNDVMGHNISELFGGQIVPFVQSSARASLQLPWKRKPAMAIPDGAVQADNEGARDFDAIEAGVAMVKYSRERFRLTSKTAMQTPDMNSTITGCSKHGNSSNQDTKEVDDIAGRPSKRFCGDAGPSTPHTATTSVTPDKKHVGEVPGQISHQKIVN